MNLTTSGATRGCGKRKQGGLYLCCGLGPGGRPIEEFVIDPPIPWENGHFQGAEIRQRADGIYDVLLWVGEEFYPFVPDFVEEARRLGISKKVSPDIDFSMMTPYQSRIILVHPRTITDDGYSVLAIEDGCVPHIPRPDKKRPECDHPLTRDARKPNCTFALWDLSSMEDKKNHELEEVADTTMEITTPSCKYKVMIPFARETISYTPGMFLAVPFTHFEYVNKKGTIPTKVADKLGGNIDHTAVTEE